MMLSRKEVAKKLGVSDRTIGRWIEERKIPYSNLNGIIRFDSEKIDMWLSRKEVKQKQIA